MCGLPQAHHGSHQPSKAHPKGRWEPKLRTVRKGCFQAAPAEPQPCGLGEEPVKKDQCWSTLQTAAWRYGAHYGMQELNISGLYRTYQGVFSEHVCVYGYCCTCLCVRVPCSRLDMEARNSGSLASVGLPDSAHPNKLWSFSLSWGPAIPTGNPQSHLSAYEIPTSPCIYLTEGCTSEGTPAGISLYWSICHGEGKRAAYTLLGKQRWNTLQRLVFHGNFHLAALSNSSC